MKLKRISYIFCVLIAAMIFNACDDSGTNPPKVSTGQFTLSLVNFKTLDPVIDGHYHLWLLFVDSLGGIYKNLGQFNIAADGSFTDSVGGPKTFSLGADTTYVANIKYAYITLERPGVTDTFPGPYCLMAGKMSVYLDSVSGPITIADSNAFGSVGAELLSTVDRGLYILNVKTDPSQSCARGIWLCDTLGTPTLPDRIDLNPSGLWSYEAWLEENSTDTYTKMGKFFVRGAKDDDGAGPCAGSITSPYNVPGQEWTNDSCTTIRNLRDGNHGIVITITPKDRTGTTPFFFRVFEQNLIQTSLGCGQQDNLFFSPLIPKARLMISRVRP